MMTRLVPCLVGSALVSSLVLLAAPKGAAVGARTVPGDGALNHWVLDAGGMSSLDVRRFAEDYVGHLREAHPEVTLTIYTEFGSGGSRIHLLLETVNSTAQQVFFDRAKDEVCQALSAREVADFEAVTDENLRLVAADPDKERRVGLQDGLIVWELDTHFPRVGQAVECIEALVRHVNATYPSAIVRGYDTWFPDTGRMRLYLYGSGIPGWEQFEAKLRRDPVVREIFEGAAEAFVPGGFRDTWMVILARQ